MSRTSLHVEYVKDSADADQVARRVKEALGKRLWGWVLTTVCRHDIQLCRMRQQIEELQAQVGKGRTS